MPKDPDPLRKITVRLPESLVRAAKVHAAQTDQDLQEVVHSALLRFLARKAAR